MKQDFLDFLKYKAYKLRYDSIISTTQAGSGHVTSCLSTADIVTVLFFHAMKFDPNNFENSNNDNFILSKGHAAPVLYSVWHELGVLSEKDLLTLRQFDSVLEGHPTPRFNKVQAATGSLGQGLSIATGIALSAKLDKKDFYTYVLIGDSESTEGQIWEAVELAYYYQLDNLIAILDVNRLGQSGETIEGWDVERHENKFKAFGWQTQIVNGHNIKELVQALDEFKTSQNNKPKIIIAKTVKGYGIESVENKNGYHGKAFTKDELPKILNELNKRFPQEAHYKESFQWNPKLSNKNDKEFEPIHIKLPTVDFDKNEKLATRKAYGIALEALDNVCDNFVVLDAEVKNSTFSQTLEKKDKTKFIECFIAEQNMISMAVGLSTKNKITFSSTFACFLTRAFDQLRMAAISRASLRVCGSHAGVSIGEDGPSQMGLEDIAMFRTLPDSIILYPCDAISTYKCVELISNYNSGISYLRTTRPETPIIYQDDEQFQIGGCKVLKESAEDKACIIAAGITLFEALKAYEKLKEEDIFVSVIDLYSIKPIDKKTILETIKKHKKVITVEDHYLQGGIGEAITYVLRNENIKIKCLAVNKLPRSGSKDKLMAFEAIDVDAIAQAIKEIMI